MAMRSHSRFTLYWLLTLEVLLPKGWSGIVPMTSGSSRNSLDVPGTSTQTWGRQRGENRSWVGCWLKVRSSTGEERPEAHLEHVLHFDDATVQDGGTHWWDLDGSAVPRLPALGAHHVAAQCADHSALLLHGPASDERLRLDDVGFGHHRSRGRVVKLGKHGDHLACGEETYVRNGRPSSCGGAAAPGAGLTWGVAFAIDLCSHRHLSETSVPRPCYLVPCSSLRRLTTEATKWPSRPIKLSSWNARAQLLTSKAGVLMSMGSITVNSFLIFLTVARGLCSFTLTQ